MAKQKKRGFFSWLGFGEKEQETEQKTEEQQVVEEPSQPETPVETAAVVEAEEPAHSSGFEISAARSREESNVAAIPSVCASRRTNSSPPTRPSADPAGLTSRIRSQKWINAASPT